VSDESESVAALRLIAEQGRQMLGILRERAARPDESAAIEALRAEIRGIASDFALSIGDVVGQMGRWRAEIDARIDDLVAAPPHRTAETGTKLAEMLAAVADVGALGRTPRPPTAEPSSDDQLAEAARLDRLIREAAPPFAEPPRRSGPPTFPPSLVAVRAAAEAPRPSSADLHVVASRELLIEGVAEEDYFDDQGTEYGLTVDDPDSDLSVTLRSVVGVAGAERSDHHALHRLAGRRVIVTVYLADER
jgi:hypothetical protein